MQHYYSEWEPFAAEWLTNLGQAGLIPAGRVDQRDVKEVTADDLEPFDTCHFFAGLGGWAYALQLAGWPATRPVWTASLPCQPFSAAGKQKGEEDERHLWPVFFRLVCQRQPPVIFGEQVNSDDGYRWLAGIRHDLEAEGYAVGCADLPACSQGAPHIRGRLFWVGYAGSPGREGGKRPALLRENGRRHGERGSATESGDSSGSGWGSGLGALPVLRELPVHDAQDARLRVSLPAEGGVGEHAVSRFWDTHDVLRCRDGRPRRTGPGIFPLAHGVSGRVGQLRAAGNAIVPQVAASFIRAFLEAEREDGHRWTESR